jgi:hypothetical protein
MLLEKNPCDHCVWVSKFVVNGDGTISVDISIRHPFPGNDYFTGFDVRGIFHTTANYFFPEPTAPSVGHRVPALETGDPQLLNADGYTDAYNPDELQNEEPIFKYQPGGDLGGSFEGQDWEWQAPLMPFICYCSSEVRRHFASNKVLTRTYHIALPPGEWDFGYTIDACWAPPIKDPVTDIEKDFPMHANTLKAYRVDAIMSGPLIGDAPSTLTVRIYNYFPGILQLYDRPQVIYVAPCLMSDYKQFRTPFIGSEYVEIKFDIVNDMGAPPGNYPVYIPIFMIQDAYLYLKEIEEHCGRNADFEQVAWVEVQG